MPYFKYLKTREEYENDYDEVTVKLCRSYENSFLKQYPNAPQFDLNKKEYKDEYISLEESEKNKKEHDEWFNNLPKEKQEMINKYEAFRQIIHLTALSRAANRNDDIEKSMIEDRLKDEKRSVIWGKYPKRTDKRCRKCGDLMSCFHKDFSYISGQENRILFMYECVDCKYREGEFENGEIWKRKKPRCPECNAVLEESKKRLKAKIRHYSRCPNCSYEHVCDLDLSDKPKKKTKAEIEAEKLMEKDKSRFCLSEEDGAEMRRFRTLAKELDESIKREEELEKIGESRKQIDQLEKIPFLEAQKRIKDAIKGKKFLKLKFGEPNMGRDIIFEFKVYESDAQRGDREAIKELKSIINKGLSNTNWKLMSEGISSRMGIFIGRIRGVEYKNY